MATAFTGNGVTFVRWAAIVSALKLEALGIKHSRGSVTAMVKRELGVKGNRDKVIAAAQAKLEEVRASVQPGEVR